MKIAKPKRIMFVISVHFIFVKNADSYFCILVTNRIQRLGGFRGLHFSYMHSKVFAHLIANIFRGG